jgi:peptidyl-prolyl cis-trans isomerase C
VGAKLVDEAGKAMAEVVGAIKRVTDVVAEISAASEEQSAGIGQVNDAITQMDQVTQQNAALVEEAAAAAESMQLQAQQLAAAGRPVTPEMQGQLREEVIAREVFMQEAQKQGLDATDDYKNQLELARQAILIRQLFDNYRKTNPVTDADVQAEYDKFVAANSGKEFKARHILVETEDQAKQILADLKKGAKFEDIAKKQSKDPGSGANGGDLDFAAPGSYVPEFSQAMVKLKKGEMTQEPVKTQFGFHIIKLEDSREATFPAFDEVKPQLMQRVEQTKLQKYQDDLKKAAKTDYKFAQQ